MKHPVPVFLLIIPIGFLVIALTVLIASFYSPGFFNSLFLESRKGGPPVLMYIGLVLFPVIAGVIMGLAITILSKWEDRDYERLLKTGRNDQRLLYRDFTQSVENIETSIKKIRRSSEILKYHAGALRYLGEQLQEKSSPPTINVEQSETRSLTLENNIITDIHLIQPVEELIPPGLSQPPQIHQKQWFFPRK